MSTIKYLLERVLANTAFFLMESGRVPQIKQNKFFHKKYQKFLAVDTPWFTQTLRWRATTLVVVLWALVSMVMICCLQMLQVTTLYG